MNDALFPPEPTPQPKDAANWAEHGTHLRVSSAPPGAVNLNVEGHNVVGPLQGFGQMWQKTFRVSLAGADVTPAQVIAEWKKHFPDFWPKGNRFYLPLTGITPGEVALLNLKPAGMPLSTGVLVLYADDESFTLMTPEGHVFAGWITFAAFRNPQQEVIAQAQVLMRANDPLFELALAFGGQAQENRFWIQTLTNLAAYFHVEAMVTLESNCVDKRRQWRYAGNIRYNSALRTLIFTPASWFGRTGDRSRSS
ncbi:MAG: hypothetical protein ACLQUY_19505 [Ktedonobacterales bacterium]